MPVGLTLMQTDAATGSVTISDCYVYGAPLDAVGEKLLQWTLRAQNKQMLRELVHSTKENLYLRVINRVYLTGGVNISLTNDRAFGGGAEAGEPLGLPLPDLRDEKAMENYAGMLEALNEELAKSIPGAKLKVALATSRSVTLTETFDRPLAIGYLAFDFPVMEGGELGVPVATQDHIARRMPRPFPDVKYRVSAVGRELNITQAIEMFTMDHDRLPPSLQDLYPDYIDMLPLPENTFYVGSLPEPLPLQLIIRYDAESPGATARNCYRLDGSVEWIEDSVLLSADPSDTRSLRWSYEQVVTLHGEELTSERKSQLQEFYKLPPGS